MLEKKVAAALVADLQSTADPALEMKVKLDAMMPRTSSPIGARRSPRKISFFKEPTSHR
jgi:hypothetical protein